MVCLVQGVGDDGTKIVNLQEVSRLRAREPHNHTQREGSFVVVAVVVVWQN